MRYRNLFRGTVGALFTLGLIGAYPSVASAGTAPTGVGNPQRPTAASANDSDGVKTAEVTCPAGQVVVGGGGYIEGGSHQVRLRGLFPVGVNAFRAVAKETIGGYSGSWRVVVQATCLPTPAGYEIRDDLTTGDTGGTRSARATCSTGKKLLGVGASVGGDEIAVDAIIPSSDLTSVTARAVLSGGDGTTLNVRAFAICADPVSGQYRQQTAAGQAGNYSEINQQDYCRTSSTNGGYVATGLGFANSGAGGAVVLSELSFGYYNRLTVRRLGPDYSYPVYWTTTLYQICAPR